MREGLWKRMIARFMIACLLFSFVLGALPERVRAEGTPKPLPEDIARFPVSYQAKLYALKQAHPNWVFEPIEVMDFDIAVKNEMRDGKSLVHKSLPEHVKEGAYDQGNWFFASKAILAYYMDPRNSLTESTIFQFEQLTYNSQYHTLDALEKFLANTFMGGGKLVPETVLTYPFLIYACGKHETITTSPFHLAARILQEQGDGTSPLISGNYPGYEGYYNYYNIGATGTTNAQIITNGLEYAKKKWGLGAYNAIYVGSQIIAENYIRKGQDSLYLQKFNVNTSTPYTHQYMQNITAPTTESSSIKSLYEAAGALNSPFVFRIPVYKNMPEEATPMPTYSTNIVLVIPSDSNDPYNYTSNYVTVDGVVYEAESYYNSLNRTRRLIVTLPDGTSEHAWIEVKDAAGNIVRGYYWDLTYYGTYYRATEGTKPTPKICTISFDANGGSGIMSSIQVQQGTSYVLPECTFQPAAGYEFEKWDLGEPGDEIVVTRDVTVKACWSEVAESIIIENVRAVLEGRLGLAFQFTIPDRIFSDQNAYALFTQEEIEHKVYLKDAAAVETQDGVQYRFYHYLAAARFKDNVKIRFYDGQGRPISLVGHSGTDHTQEGINYSVASYIAALKSSSELKNRTLARGMENYCVAAQIYFNYNVEEGLAVTSAVTNVGMNQLGEYQSTSQGSLPSGVTGKGIRVSFESNNAIKILFTFEEGVDPYSYTYRIDGKKTTLREDGGIFYIQSKGIPALYLDQEITFSITKKKVTHTITCSALTYARAIYLSDDEKAKNLGQALYLYNRAAKLYFGSGNYVQK
ncbi:MAG: hypothetical protein IKS85_02645 [Lachnospiraceae bacterium]|nr:hypothetical protein [Lachnospiraceae bacterium]